MKSFTSSAATLSIIVALPLVFAGPSGLDPNHLPDKSEPGQYGYNNCKYGDSVNSECQTLHLNSLEDFCLFAPPSVNTIGDSERYEVAYCLKSHGARLMPAGTITGAHFVKTPHYIQITGKGNFKKIGVKGGDSGGELDSHGYDSLGNPIGGVVVMPGHDGKPVQVTEWAQFISDTDFCIKACYPDPKARSYCPHIYDEMGCDWNMPANYANNVFETCEGDDALPAGRYVKNGKTSTWSQGINPTPSAHPIPKSSQCVKEATLQYATYKAAPTKVVTTKKSSSTKKVTSSKKTGKASSTKKSSTKPLTGAKKPKVGKKSSRQSGSKRAIAGDL